MQRFRKLLFYWGCCVLAGHWSAIGQQSNGLAEYREANFKVALPLLRKAAPSEPANAKIQAALLTALVYEDQVDESSDVFDDLATKFPNDPGVLAARGDFLFYMGDTAEAERIYKLALKGQEDPRACLGFARVLRAASMYRSARLLTLRAHELDATDALITKAWIAYLVGDKRKQVEPAFVETHPWLYEVRDRASKTGAELKNELAGRRVDEPEAVPQPTSLHLIQLLYGPQRVRGLGITFAIEGGKPLHLLLDTGASGILINQRAIDKVGLDHLGAMELHGIGDAGKQSGFLSIASTCQVGTLVYKTCLMHVLEGKRSVTDEDGLIGADFFSDYSVQIDFAKGLLNLEPLPQRDPSPQGYDRTIPPNEKDFTPVFRFGHRLMIPTRVNGKTTGLFLIDTGAGMSTIDSTFARLSTKVYGNSWMHVKGISGDVKEVFEAGKAELQFARFRQSNLGLTSFNLSNTPQHGGPRMAGILGYPLLSLFKLTIDYRNGLVNFDYTPR